MQKKERQPEYDRTRYLEALQRYVHITYPINPATAHYLEDTGIREGVVISVFGDDETCAIFTSNFVVPKFDPKSHLTIIVGKPNYVWARYNHEENLDSLWFKVSESYHGGGAGISSTRKLVPVNGDMNEALAALYLSPNLTKFPVPKKSDF